MCLILVAWRSHPDFPLVVAANRDEFYARPSAPAGPWAEDPRVLGGRDLEAGGSWLGARRDGRFAAVTNVREPGVPKGPRSRGLLVGDFLLGGQEPGEYAAAIQDRDYSGYNLLVADDRALWYRSNREGGARELPPGIYGVSNHLLDTPWPKLVTAKARFHAALEQLPGADPLFGILGDTEIVPDQHLPHTGLPPDWERMLSAVFVRSATYGTRASTILTWDRNRTLSLQERRFGVQGVPLGATRLGF